MPPIRIPLPYGASAAHWLEAVIPHLSDDETLPPLGCVRIEVGDGYVLAVATDRYTLGASRLDTATGTGRGVFTVPGSWVRSVVDYCETDDAEDGPADLVLLLSPDRCSLTGDGVELLGAPLAEDAEWLFDWRTILGRALERPAVTEPMSTTTRLLGRFAPHLDLDLAADGTAVLTGAAQITTRGQVPYAIHLPGGNHPMVLSAPGFIGLIAPQRRRGTGCSASAAAPVDPREAWGPILATAVRA